MSFAPDIVHHQWFGMTQINESTINHSRRSAVDAYLRQLRKAIRDTNSEHFLTI